MIRKDNILNGSVGSNGSNGSNGVKDRVDDVMIIPFNRIHEEVKYNLKVRVLKATIPFIMYNITDLVRAEIPGVLNGES